MDTKLVLLAAAGIGAFLIFSRKARATSSSPIGAGESVALPPPMPPSSAGAWRGRTSVNGVTTAPPASAPTESGGTWKGTPPVGPTVMPSAPAVPSGVAGIIRSAPPPAKTVAPIAPKGKLNVNAMLTVANRRL